MPKVPSVTNHGFSLLEAILAFSIFALLVTIFVGALVYGQESTAAAGGRTRAVVLAEEGLEAVRNIRDASFGNLVNGTHGLAISGNTWVWSGTSDTVEGFIRQISISTAAANRKQVVSTVTWQQSPARTGSVSLTTYLTNWEPF